MMDVFLIVVIVCGLLLAGHLICEELRQVVSACKACDGMAADPVHSVHRFALLWV